MSRYRNWVGALHWGQLLLLVPTLLFDGGAVGGGALVYWLDAGRSERYEFDAAEAALREFREDPSADIPKEGEDEFDAELRRRRGARNSFQRTEDRRQQLEADLVRAAEEAQAAKERVESRGAWVLGSGMLGWALAWLTAFLSLWWWFGARAKSGTVS
jgi:hypothetical protein